MHIAVRLILSLLLLAGSFHSGAQAYSYIHYDAKDGLPSPTVYDITQDQDGFIWFGTENGLSRFDGKNFKTFTTKDGLPDNSILRVFADLGHRVYFGPFTHNLHYYENDSFHKLVIPPAYLKDLSDVSFFANTNKNVLVCGFGESYFIQGNTVISIHDRYNQVPRNVLVNRSYDDLIVVGKKDSVFLINDNGQITYSRDDPRFTLIYDDFKQRQYHHLPDVSIFRITNYLRGNMLYWFWNDTIHIYNLTSGQIVHTIRMEKFSKAFFDNENNLWVLTLGNGVFRFPSFNFSEIPFDGKSEIFSIARYGNNIVAGTDFSQLYIRNANDHLPDYTIEDFSRFNKISANPIPQLTRRNRIYVLKAAGDELYVGTDAFLIKKKFGSPIATLPIPPIKDIDLFGKKVLVCTSRAAFVLDGATLRIADTLIGLRTTCGALYHDHYFIGTLGGLVRIDARTKVIERLYDSFPPFKGRITAIKRGIHDDLWIATSGSGLIHFKGNNIIKTFREEDGLTSSICTSVFVDSNLVWLGTNAGLCRIDADKPVSSITRITSANGLGADFVNTLLVDDSDLYVGTAAGLTIFKKDILAEKSVCMLHILDVSENNKRLPKDSIYSFPFNALNIQVNFTAVSFKSAGDISYYYQLEGLDNGWNTASANFVNFPTLPVGNYTLLLKAINKFGVESAVKSLTIIIRPAWWQTVSFRFLAAAVLILLVFIIYQYNIRSIRRKEQVKREFEARFAALEQRALQAQMNPHFIFNALNSIQNFILNLDVEGANAYLTNFASLIRQTLENSMQPLITLNSEIKYLETYLSLEKLRFRDKFNFKIDLDETIETDSVLLPGMLLQPYIENAIRHGIQHRNDNLGLVTLTIRLDREENITYTINDNGVGRQRAAELKSQRHIEYHSRGISINEKRIAAINNQYKTNITVNISDIIDEQGQVAGTSVTIRIPPLSKL
jgi:hypothetical protein